MARAVSRRMALGGLLGALPLAACRVIGAPKQNSLPSAASSAGGSVAFDAEGWSPAIIRAFNDSHPEVQLHARGFSGHVVHNTLESFVGGEVARTVSGADLSVALKTLNVKVGTYLPGVWKCWTAGQRIIGVPFSVSPWGVIWRKDAFAAARLSPPAADWSFDDFRLACAALQALAKSGRLKGLHAALGPMAAQLKLGSGFFYFGPLWQAGLWQAFVRGFGGTIAAGGRFTLTAAKTLAAFGTLVDLATQFSLPGKDANGLITMSSSGHTLSGFSKVYDLFAMRFSPYTGYTLPAPYAWARLPRFPVQPVIPVVSDAMVLRAPGALPSPGSAAALAAAEFGVWLDTPPALQADTYAPAIAAASVQNAFWSGEGLGAAKAVGDWHNFRDAFEDFPAVPSRDFVANALYLVLENKAALPAALAQAEKSMNAAVPP